MPSLLNRELADMAIELAEAAQPGARVVADLRKELPRLERPLERELNKAFKELGELVAAAAEGQGGILIEATKRERKRIMAILNAANVEQWANQTIGPMIEKQWKRVIDSTLRVMKKNDLKISLRSKIEKQLLKQGATRPVLKDIRVETKEALFRVLEKGRKDGLNPRETAKLIRQYVPKGRFVNAGSGYRAELIARTESLEAQRHSSIKMYESSDVIKEVIAFDGDKDGECAERNGSTYSFEEAAAEADGTHPSCVLAFGPVV